MLMDTSVSLFRACSVLLAIVASAFVTSGKASLAEAAEFRVDNSVFVAGQQEPVSQSMTVFHAGLVYDFIRRPAELMVYDPRSQMLTLVDPQRQVRTSLSKADLAGFCQQLKRWADSQADPATRFSANPQFEIHFDEARKEMSARSTWISYRVVGRAAEDAEMLRQYHEFVDCSAQMNALLNPGSRLPFPRLALNQHLTRRSLLPERVELTISTTRGGNQKQITLRSEHRWKETLAEADLARIREVQKWLVEFKPVPIGQYIQTAKNR